jgi:1-aminocyclopropane-1-carboxylate deaminase
VTTISPDLKYISLDHWDHVIFRQHNLQVDVLRLDKIHPDISGNKWFKLKYYLERARETNKHNLISFGGAYSNHLLALAAAAKIYGFASQGMIRGDEPARLSHTLLAAKEYGMELRFLSRVDYNRQKNYAAIKNQVDKEPEKLDEIKTNTPEENETDALLIPEGGAGIEGLRGAEEILSGISTDMYTHVCCAAGTGTTMAGLINGAGLNQIIIGVSVLKGTRDFEPLNISWIKNREIIKNVQMIHSCHFGGYAKYTKSLIDFMNRIFAETGIPTDFVYTGKLFYSIVRMAELKAFPARSRILVLHSGGLQGNRSLTPGLLQF